MKKGFTIVELIIYMGLLAVLLVVITEISLSILDLQSQTTATSAVAQDGKFILTRLGYDIRQASTISTPASLGQSANSASLIISGTPYTYSEDQGKLSLTTGGTTSDLNSIGSTISDVSFTRLGNVGGKNSLQIKFKLTATNKTTQGLESQNFETTVGLR